MSQQHAGPKVPADYNQYKLTAAQVILSALVMGLGAAVLAYIFYMNIYIAAAAMLFGLLGPKIYRRHLIEKRKRDLNIQFKDFLYALNSSVGAGKSLREGIISARNDMKILYMNDNAILIRELDSMVLKLEMKARVTTLMSSLAARSGNEDIMSFATVLENGETKGINPVELIQKTVRVISEKLEVKNEIATKVASMKMEQRVMLVMPVLLTLMMNILSPDYMKALYESPSGYLIITVALALIAVAAVISNKITNIKV